MRRPFRFPLVVRVVSGLLITTAVLAAYADAAGVTLAIPVVLASGLLGALGTAAANNRVVRRLEPATKAFVGGALASYLLGIAARVAGVAFTPAVVVAVAMAGAIAAGVTRPRLSLTLASDRGSAD